MSFVSVQSQTIFNYDVKNYPNDGRIKSIHLYNYVNANLDSNLHATLHPQPDPYNEEAQANKKAIHMHRPNLKTLCRWKNIHFFMLTPLRNTSPLPDEDTIDSLQDRCFLLDRYF